MLINVKGWTIVKGGIIGILSGTISNIRVTKKNVIYINKSIVKGTRSIKKK